MANKRAATGYFTKDTKTRINPDEVVAIASGPGVSYSATPLASAKWAAFLYRVGRDKVVASSWKDLFFEEIHDTPGS